MCVARSFNSSRESGGIAPQANPTPTTTTNKPDNHPIMFHLQPSPNPHSYPKPSHTPTPAPAPPHNPVSVLTLRHFLLKSPPPSHSPSHPSEDTCPTDPTAPTPTPSPADASCTASPP